MGFKCRDWVMYNGERVLIVGIQAWDQGTLRNSRVYDIQFNDGWCESKVPEDELGELGELEEITYCAGSAGAAMRVYHPLKLVK